MPSSAARQRERYANDLEYRERRKAASRAQYQKMRAECPQGHPWRVQRNRYRAERQQRLKQRVAALKESTPCADCGVSYPACVMDFDHVRGEKSAKVSRLVVSSNWEGIQAEIDKCDIVCANCHRIRTRDRAADKAA